MSDRAQMTALRLAALVGLVTMSPEALLAQAASTCVTFDELPDGTHYTVGQSFTSDGVTMQVKSFTWGNGNTTSGGSVRVHGNQLSGGQDLDLNLNNANLEFDFGGSLEGLALLFGEFGGNLNLEVNGDFRNFANFQDLHLAGVGGVQVSVTNGGGNDRGTLVLTGTISSFSIGGQELWIDNVCPGRVPGIANEYEVSLYLGGFFTEDTNPLNSGLDTGFRYARKLRAQLWVELETGIAFTEEVSWEGLFGHAQINVRWHPVAPTPAVDPFVLVGVGQATYNTIGDSENSPLVVAGLGAEFYWLDTVGFRLEGRYLLLTDFYGDSTSNGQIFWGPVFWF